MKTKIIILAFTFLSTAFTFLSTACTYDKQTNQETKNNIKMIPVKGGTFQMGENAANADELPVHTVKLSDFKISKYEITNKQYCDFLNSKASLSEKIIAERINITSEFCQIEKDNSGIYLPKKGKDNFPVIKVTWEGAKAFCEWAGGRLPTEAEWEYAARGGLKSKNYIFSGSDYIDEAVWYDTESTHEVGLKRANELGIHDMSGNVWEWCNDWYSEDYYKRSPKQNPQGPLSSEKRILRGGSGDNPAPGCTVTNRVSSKPDKSYSFVGFRLVIPVSR